MNRKVEKCFDRMPGRGGNFCFDGLLRFFLAGDINWTSAWSSCSGLNFDWSEAIAYDIFGTVYAVDDSGQVYVFSLDSGDKSYLEVDLDGFFSAIEYDPISTIRSNVYEEAILRLGRLNYFENYALKVEEALGGEFCVDNMYICERVKHASILGGIARQIRNLPVGTRLIPRD
ncbi:MULTISPECIES: hypothetical protein [Xanthomonas]|uniref:Uncharacterized protein n=1 Tax=Xanthomonas sontii TaxID=2650745 RepID=A0A6N7Q8G2_9XANT|nr:MULTISPECIES: hypothetical protein [Xanthomonas]MRH00574.1 hypothetical protein [Xanthomonas sontii]MRH74906.1 hypothetical protein [Xanthomonas sontii]UYK76772.1 hypothetical protein NG825_20635 [Xanthomonas sacchari]